MLSFLVLLETLSEVERVLEMLAPDVVFYGDGGGIGRGLPRPIYGIARASRLLAAFAKTGSEITARIELTQINGQPGTLNFDAEDRLINAFAFEISGGAIQSIRSIINPQKLGHLGYPLSPLAQRSE